jgi:hypothetical protein
VVCLTLMYLDTRPARVQLRSKFWGPLETGAVINIISHSLRISQLLIVGMVPNHPSNYRNYLLMSIWLDCGFFLFGGLAASVLVLEIARVYSNGMNLYNPISYRGRTINVSGGLMVLRLIIAALNIIFTSLFGQYAHSIQTFRFHQRLIYFMLASASAFLSAPITYYFGRRVIKRLERFQNGFVEDTNEFAAKSIAVSRMETSHSDDKLDRVKRTAMTNTPGHPAQLHSIKPTSLGTKLKDSEMKSGKDIELQKKVNTFKFIVIYFVIFYYAIALATFMIPFMNEASNGSETTMLVSKILIDFILWTTAFVFPFKKVIDMVRNKDLK